jgi:HlyD family secretion protein
MRTRKISNGPSPVLWIVLAACLAGCDVSSDATPATSLATDTPVAVAKGRIDVEGGVIQIAAARDGVIAEVMVNEGARVTKGEILARQDARMAEVALLEAEAAIKPAVARVALLDTQLEAAEREAARLNRLAEIGAETFRTRDEAQDRVQQLIAEARVAHAEVEAAKARARVARLEVEQREIRAPIDGVILRRSAHPGAGASTLNVTSLFTMAPQTAKIVRSELEESFVGKVVFGQRVEIIGEANPSQVGRGRVVSIGQVFGVKRGGVDDPNEKVDERVVEVVTSLDTQSFLIGQRVRVNFQRGMQ